MPQDAAQYPREGELAETTRPLAFTIGAAAATLAIVLGAIAGPTVVNCFGSEDGLGSCVYQSLADTWFSPGDEAVSVADGEPAAPADEAAQPAIREPEGEADEPGEPAPEPDAEAMIAATFGLLRAEPDGFAVITGSGTPGSEVEILVDGEPFGRAEVDATGDWVFVPETPLPAGGVEITLAEIGREGLGPESFVVLIDPERTAQPMVVASRPGEASDILQGLVRQPDLVVADAPPPESTEDEQVSGEDEQPAPAESADVNAADAEPAKAESAAADEPAVADASAVEAEAGEEAVAIEPEPEPEPETEAERIETALLPDAATPPEPEPAFVIGATPPSIDAIEIDGDRNFFAGGGPEGVVVRLYVDDVFVADSVVEGGRWLVEAGNVLTATMHTVRIDMLAPGSATVAARAGVNFVVDLPAGTREDDLVIAGLPEPVESPAAEAESAAPDPEVPAEDAAQADEVADVSESVVADAPAEAAPVETPRSDEGEVAAEDAPEGTLDVTEAGIVAAPEAETPGAEAVGEAIEPMPGEDDAAAVEAAAEPVAAEAEPPAAESVGDDALSVAPADEPAAEAPDEPALEPETPVGTAPLADEAAEAGAPVTDAVIAPADDPVPSIEGGAPEAGVPADEAPADEAAADAEAPAETPAEAKMLPEIETPVEVLAEADRPAAELETAAEPVAEPEPVETDVPEVAAPVEDEPVADEAAIDAAPAAEAVPGESMSDAAPAVEEPVADAAPVPDEPAVDTAPVMEAAPAEPMTDAAPVAEEPAVDAVPAAQAVPEGIVVDAAPATDEPGVEAALVAEDAPGEPETTPAAEPVPAVPEPEAPADEAAPEMPADEAVSEPALEEPAIAAAQEAAAEAVEEPAAPDAAVTEPVVEEPAVRGLDPSLPTLVASPVGDPEAQRFASGRAIIRRGDNLWTIARRVYGAGIRYTTIYEANTEQIRDPHRIYPGQVFDLPQAESQE